LQRHIENVRQFGVPAVVAINRFHTDSDEELAAIETIAAAHGSEALVCTHWADGGAGAAALAERVVAIAEAPSQFAPLYDDALPLFEKINTVATRIYRAETAIADPAVHAQLAALGGRRAWQSASVHRQDAVLAFRPIRPRWARRPAT